MIKIKILQRNSQFMTDKAIPLNYEIGCFL